MACNDYIKFRGVDNGGHARNLDMKIGTLNYMVYECETCGRSFCPIILLTWWDPRDT